MSSFSERLKLIWQSHGREVLQFLSVGGAAFVINSAVTWTLMHSIFEDGHGKAKVAAGIVATLFSWVANRLWTFKEKRTGNKWREAVEFAIVNAIGIGVELGCVLFSFYVLQLTSPTASFISGTIIGTILGTIVRYFLYKFWVFSKSKGKTDLTEEERRAQLIAETTQIMTGHIPQVKAEQIKRPGSNGSIRADR